jgi:hypothetical protein
MPPPLCSESGREEEEGPFGQTPPPSFLFFPTKPCPYFLSLSLSPLSFKPLPFRQTPPKPPALLQINPEAILVKTPPYIDIITRSFHFKINY